AEEERPTPGSAASGSGWPSPARSWSCTAPTSSSTARSGKVPDSPSTFHLGAWNTCRTPRGCTGHERRPATGRPRPGREPLGRRGPPRPAVLVLEGEARRPRLPAVLRLPLLPDARGQAPGGSTALP